MSRDGAFDGLGDVLTPGEREIYIPGKHELEGELADHVADRFLSSKRLDLISLMDLSRDIASELPDIYEESFSPNALLDALMARIAFGGQAGHQMGLDLLLVPLVEKYYKLGYNDFLVDLSPLEHGPNNMLTCFLGKEDRPLKLTWNSNNNMYDFARNTRHCDLVFYGSAHLVGWQAENVTIDVRGKASGVGNLSLDSTYYIPSFFQIPWLSSACRGPTRCDFHITQPIPEHHDVADKVNDQFYEQENRILVPDETGGWEELLVKNT